MSNDIHQLRIPATGATGQAWELAATVYLPSARSLASGPDILFLMAGAGYNRDYFDLPVDGFSQARYHAGRGNIVVTLDNLGAGESSRPEVATLIDAAAATDSAVRYIEKNLVQGTLLPDLGPVRYGAFVAAGQSLGGFVLLATQGLHDTFKGIATLGVSAAGTKYPAKGGGTTDEPTAEDFVYAFHWEEVVPIDPATTPTDLETLVGVDVAIGLPRRTGQAPWSTSPSPVYTVEALQEGVPASFAARITAPVLVVAGERDMTRSLDEEAAPFTASPDVVTYELPEAAHMHNFSKTRAQLWKRLDTFVMHASTFERKASATSLEDSMRVAMGEGEDA